MLILLCFIFSYKIMCLCFHAMLKLAWKYVISGYLDRKYSWNLGNSLNLFIFLLCRGHIFLSRWLDFLLLWNNLLGFTKITSYFFFFFFNNWCLALWLKCNSNIWWAQTGARFKIHYIKCCIEAMSIFFDHILNMQRFWFMLSFRLMSNASDLWM